MAIMVSKDPPNTLQWDFYKSAENRDTQTIHYYDGYAQEIWPSSSGLKTRTTKVFNGNWDEANWDIDHTDIVKSDYYQLKSDHPTNGVLYMVTTHGSKLEFMRYQYMMDISHIIQDYDQQYKNDSSVSDLRIGLMNIGMDVFAGDGSLFLPGAKLELNVAFDKTVLPMGVYWIDSVGLDELSESIKINSRNFSGHWLTDQTMDELTEVNGTMKQCIETIFMHAGLTNYVIQDGFTNINKYKFEPSDTIMDAIQQIMNSARNPQPEFEMVLLESPQGGIIYGRRNWADQYIPNSYYQFQEGIDLFSRSSEKCLDGSYTRIMLTCEKKGSDPKVDHPPIFKDVNNFKNWYIKTHKTKHIRADKPLTLEEFTKFAEGEQKAYQYVGINEEFVGPYRPQLYIGDIAEVIHPNQATATSLGIVNQISHTFSIDDGFQTEFVVDSGGVHTDGSDYVVYTGSSKDHGRNRKMNIVDVIKVLRK